jgi:hypothetical protein
VDGEIATPELESSVTILLELLYIQISPLASTAIPLGAPFMPPPVNVSVIVKSFGLLAKPGPNGDVPAARAYRLAVSAAGLCAILIATVAVSPG